MKRRPLPVSTIPAACRCAARLRARCARAARRQRLDLSRQRQPADEITLRWNRAAFEEMRLATRVLQGFAQGGTETKTAWNAPAASGAPRAGGLSEALSSRRRNWRARARAAAMNTIFVAATLASVSLEETAAAAEGEPQWFQLYLQPERSATLDLVRRAESGRISGPRHHDRCAGKRSCATPNSGSVSGFRRMSPQSISRGGRAHHSGAPMTAILSSTGSSAARRCGPTSTG